MHRLIAAAAVGLALSAGAAQAAEVSVTIGPELQKNTRAYGAREVADLADDLRKTVDKALDRAGPDAPQRVDLVLESATPNRPTYNQLTATPGLSMFSVGVGGAAVTGTATFADGSVKPVSYRWRETDVRWVIGYSTWTDAQRTFGQLASRLARGDVPNQGPYRPERGPAAFDSLNRFR